jgi:hypothetical protein
MAALSATALTAVDNIVPVGLPFFSPIKAALAAAANFLWQIELFMCHGALLSGVSKLGEYRSSAWVCLRFNSDYSSAHFCDNCNKLVICRCFTLRFRIQSPEVY